MYSSMVEVKNSGVILMWTVILSWISFYYWLLWRGLAVPVCSSPVILGSCDLAAPETDPVGEGFGSLENHGTHTSRHTVRGTVGLDLSQVDLLHPRANNPQKSLLATKLIAWSTTQHKLRLLTGSNSRTYLIVSFYHLLCLFYLVLLWGRWEMHSMCKAPVWAPVKV